MRGRQLIIILILLVGIGGTGVFLYNRSAQSWKNSSSTAGGKKLIDFPINDVAQVTIKGRGGEVNLVRASDGWKVKERADYPANFETIGGLLRRLWELRPLQEVEVGPSQFGRLELSPPGSEATTGTLLELKDAQGKRLAAMLLGKKYLKQTDVPSSQMGFPAGRYIKTEDGSNRVVLVSDTFNEVEPKPEGWLKREFFRIENPKTISLASSTADMNWNVARDTASDPWTLRDAKPGEQFDPGKFASIPGALANPMFADVLPNSTGSAETGLDQPSTLTAETSDNFSYVVRIGKQMGDNFPAAVTVTAQLPKERMPGKDEKPEDKARLDQEFQTKQKQLTNKLAQEEKLNGHIYLLAKTTIDQPLKPRSALMADKPTPTASPIATAAARPPAPPQPSGRGPRPNRSLSPAASPAKPRG